MVNLQTLYLYKCIIVHNPALVKKRAPQAAREKRLEKDVIPAII
jgi:hypothetical protein